LIARIDHAPDRLPARQVPLTALCTAFSKRSTNRASALRSTPDAHVPENSPSRPAMIARQAPVHPVADFAADHPPFATVPPCGPRSVHVPVTLPRVESATAVHVPTSVRPPPVVAAHVPERLLRAFPAESERATACALDAWTAERSSTHTRRSGLCSTVTSMLAPRSAVSPRRARRRRTVRGFARTPIRAVKRRRTTSRMISTSDRPAIQGSPAPISHRHSILPRRIPAGVGRVWGASSRRELRLHS